MRGLHGRTPPSHLHGRKWMAKVALNQSWSLGNRLFRLFRQTHLCGDVLGANSDHDHDVRHRHFQWTRGTQAQRYVQGQFTHVREFWCERWQEETKLILKEWQRTRREMCGLIASRTMRKVSAWATLSIISLSFSNSSIAG